jgi:hypothetical protein
MALATEALALEATGDRAPMAGGDLATRGSWYDWLLARMSRVASHEALPQPHILMVRHALMRRILDSTWEVTAPISLAGAHMVWCVS